MCSSTKNYSITLMEKYNPGHSTFWLTMCKNRIFCFEKLVKVKLLKHWFVYAVQFKLEIMLTTNTIIPKKRLNVRFPNQVVHHQGMITITF